MLFKRYTSLLISTSMLVQSVSPAFAMNNDSVDKLEKNLSKLKQYSSTPAPLDFMSHPEKTSGSVLHWAIHKGEVLISLGKRDDSTDQDIGEWCNFGGKSDAIDTGTEEMSQESTSEGLTNTAAREACEESNGIYACHPRLLRKQPFIALYSPDEKEGLLHYMYWQQVQYLEPEIFKKKVKEAKEEHSKEYTDFIWVKASLLHEAVDSQSPLLEVDGKKIEIYGPLFSSLSTEAGKTFLHELAVHQKIRRFNKNIRPLFNRLFIAQHETAENISKESELDLKPTSNPLISKKSSALDNIKKAFLKEVKNEIGPRAIPGWQLHDVEDNGNCFYDAVIHQMHLMGYKFLKTIKKSTLPRDSLRLCIQGKDFKDEEWAEDRHFDTFVKKFDDLILAIIDTRSPENGYVYYYLDDAGKVVTHVPESGIPLPKKLIIKLAATGNHFLSVTCEPTDKLHPQTRMKNKPAETENFEKSKKTFSRSNKNILDKGKSIKSKSLKHRILEDSAKGPSAEKFTFHWAFPKAKPTLLSTIPFGENAYGKDYSICQMIGPKGEILSEGIVLSNKAKEEDTFAEAVSAHGMAMVELKRLFQKDKRPSTELSAQWNPNCEETLSRIHLRIVLGKDYKTPKNFKKAVNSRRAADIANIKKYFTIDNEGELVKIVDNVTAIEQQRNEFKREITLLDSDYEFFADIFEWEDKNKHWPTFYHGASAKQNNMFKSFTYMRELSELRSFKDLMVLRGTDIYFNNDKTVWDMLMRTGACENSETSSAMLFLNFVLLAGLKTTKTTSSSAEYVLNDHSVEDQNIGERFEEALALAGFSNPNYAYFQSIFEQFIEHKNPMAGNSVMVAISQNPKDLDDYNYPTICGHYYDPSSRKWDEDFILDGEQKDFALSVEDSDSSSSEEQAEGKKSEKIKSTLQILNGIQNEFERQKKSGSEPFKLNTNAKRSLFPENRFFLHPTRVMDPTQTRIKPFDRFALTEEESQVHDREMRRTTIAIIADWLAQKTTIMEGSFINFPALKKLYKIIYQGLTGQELIEKPSHDGLNYLVRSGHLEAVKHYLENYPEIDPKTLATAVLESKNTTQIDYFLNDVFQGDWKVFLENNPKNKLGQTPLHLAVGAKHIELVKQFLNEVDPNIQDDEGFTPLFLAMDNDDRKKEEVSKDIVKLLLADDRVDPNISIAKEELGGTVFWLQSPFQMAMYNQDQDLAKLFLSHPNFNVNTVYKNGQTYLTIAECSNREDIVKLIFAHPNFNVNAVDQNGQTPLIRATLNKRQDIVELLLANFNLDFNIIDNYGQTALSASLIKGHEEILQILLANDKVDPNFSGNNGQTPFLTSMWNNKEAIPLLLSHPKFDVNAVDKDGNTPLSMAITYGYQDIVEILLSHPNIDVNAVDKDGNTPLSKTISYDKQDLTVLLLAHPNIDVNATDKDGNTPLARAMIYGRQDLVKLLLKNEKVDPNISTSYGMPFFEWALSSNEQDLVEFTLSHPNFDVNAVDKNGQTPLVRSISFVNQAITSSLLAHPKIDVNATDKDGNTPLARAMIYGRQDLVKLLLKNEKVDPNTTTPNGTPLMWAIRNKHQDIIDILLSHPKIDLNAPDDKDGNTCLGFCVANYNLNVDFYLNLMKVLLTKDPTCINIKNNDQTSPLLMAVNSRKQDIVKLLLSYSNIDVNAADKDGNTPLTVAIKNYWDKDTIKLLVSHPHIDINAVDQDGNTALSSAINVYLGDIIKILLSNDSLNPNVITKYGTPLEWAINSGYKDIVETLLSHPNIDVNAKDKDGNTTLSKVINRYGWEHIVKLLFSHPNIDVNEANKYSPVLLSKTVNSAKQDRVEIPYTNSKAYSAIPTSFGTSLPKPISDEGKNIVKLPQSNIDVNAYDIYGNTLLTKAIKSGNPDAVKLFLENDKVDVNLPNKNGDTPLLVAIGSGKQEIVALFLAHPKIDVNMADKFGDKPLAKAMNSGFLSIVKLLLSHEKTDYDVTTISGVPLFWAVTLGYQDILETVLSACYVDVNAIDNDGNTPLLKSIKYACKEGIIKTLLSHLLIDVNAIDKEGHTPLTKSIKFGHKDIAKLLLSHKKIEPNLKGPNGDSPLHLAVKAKSVEMVGMLLEKGADIHALDKEGRKPLFLARGTGLNADKNLSAIGELLREAHQKQMSEKSEK